jgi:glycosyltransferase involved in cell wall biosynthesis
VQSEATTTARRAPGDARRLLVITYHFDPNGSVGGFRWLGFTKYLARLGWEIAVLTAVPPNGTGAPTSVQVEWCPRLRTLLDGYRLLRRLAVGRLPSGSSDASRAVGRSGTPGLLRQLHQEVAAIFGFPDDSRGWTLRAGLRARSVIRHFQPHVVVSSGPPHTAHLVAWIATLGSAVPWWIDARDPWAGPLPKAAQSYRWGTLTFRALAPRLERLAFRAAHGVITTTPQFADALVAKYPDVPIVCIRNGVDAECLPPPAPQRYPGLSIAYVGTVYGGRDCGPLVSALRIFLERHPDAAQAGSKLRIVGEALGSHAGLFYDTVAAAGMERYVEVLGRLPRAHALSVVARSRVAAVLAQEQELQIPTKLYESVAIGIPTLVVASVDSAAGVEGRRVGAAVRDPTDVEGIAGVFQQLWRDESSRGSPCPVSITHDAIAPLVDQLLRGRSLPRAAPPQQGVTASS